MTKIRAYKAFNPDWTCRGYQYEPGKLHVHEGPIIPCQSGFHACEVLQDIAGYYDVLNTFSDNLDSHPLNRLAIVELSGEIIRHGSKVVASEIRIIQELPLQTWSEIYSDVLLVNQRYHIDNRIILHTNESDGPSLITGENISSTSPNTIMMARWLAKATKQSTAFGQDVIVGDDSTAIINLQISNKVAIGNNCSIVILHKHKPYISTPPKGSYLIYINQSVISIYNNKTDVLYEEIETK